MDNTLSLDIGSIDRFAGRYALGYERGEGSRHFLRIKVVGGELSLEQAKVVAELSENYGRGYLEVTTRHSIQLHWIRDEDAPEIFARMEEVGLNTDMCGQGYPQARYGDVRNIVTCPVSGVQRGEILDVQPIVRRAVEMFTGKPEYLDLPRKFKIAISACPLNCIRPEINDLGLIAVDSEYGLGFTAFIGGSIGISLPSPMLAKPMNVYVAPEKALEFMKAMVEVYRDHGNRESKAKARFKWMVQELGVEGVRRLVEEKIGEKLKPFPAENLKLEWSDHIGCQPQKQEGFYFIVVPTPTGILDVKQFKKIIELVEMYGGSRIRVSPLQKLVLVDVPEDMLEKVRKELDMIGLGLDRPPVRWTTLGCPTNFCGKAIENVKSRVIEIEEHLEKVFGEKLENLNIRIAISGCPNSCAHHRIAEIGLQATTIRDAGMSKPAYDVYLGGKSSRISKLFLRRVPADRVKHVVEEIVGKYLEGGFSDFRSYVETLVQGGKP